MRLALPLLLAWASAAHAQGASAQAAAQAVSAASLSTQATTAAAPGPDSASQRAASTPPLAGTQTRAPASAAPVGTSATSYSAASSVAPTAAQSHEKPVDNIARLLAAIGTLIAVVNVGLSIFKMKRDRKVSIDDDFWFRKVVTPTAIEPALEVFVELLQEMPTLASSKEEQREYSLKITKEMHKLYNTMQALALFHEKLPAEVCVEFAKCEEILGDYCGQLVDANNTQAGDTPVSAPDISTVRQQVWSNVNNAMKCIRARQIKA